MYHLPKSSWHACHSSHSFQRTKTYPSQVPQSSYSTTSTYRVGWTRHKSQPNLITKPWVCTPCLSASSLAQDFNNASEHVLVRAHRQAQHPNKRTINLPSRLRALVQSRSPSKDHDMNLATTRAKLFWVVWKVGEEDGWRPVGMATAAIYGPLAPATILNTLWVIIPNF